MFADSTQHTLTNHTHGSTFGGNPICTAGGISIIDRLDDALMEEVREKGKYIKEELEQCEHVDHVSGMGLMIGVTLKNKALMDVVEAASTTASSSSRPTASCASCRRSTSPGMN